MRKYTFMTLCAGLLFAGCDSVDNTPDTARVDVQFRAAQATSLASKAGSLSADALVLEGANGTLEITDVRLIVAELELDRTGDACETAGGAEARCENFEAEPFFLDLPLDGQAVSVATSEVPLGTYEELEFEVEDLETDADDDARKQQQSQALLSEIRAQAAFADWPANASMVAVGTFTPAGSDASVPFKVYFDAEIEVEVEFEPALTLSEDGASTDLSVQVYPALWFRTDTGVRDLSRYTYVAEQNNLVEFELELERGFGGVEFESEFDND